MSLHIFSTQHLETVLQHLSLSKEQFETKFKQAHKELPESFDGSHAKVSWRTVKKFVGTDDPVARLSTQITICEALIRLGFPASPDWLATKGLRAPNIEQILPQFVARSITVDPYEQYGIAENFGGVFALYRRHGAKEALMVRELFWVDKKPAINARVGLLNRRGSFYQGLAYKTNYVLYIDLYRPHRKYSFSARKLSVAVPSSGAKQALGGLIMRVRRTSGMSSTSDFILVRLSDKKDIIERKLSSISNKQDGMRAIDIDPIEIESNFDPIVAPRVFVDESNMDLQEKRIFNNLSEVQKVAVPDQIGELELSEIG